jgi:hypothetical protein
MRAAGLLEVRRPTGGLRRQRDQAVSVTGFSRLRLPGRGADNNRAAGVLTSVLDIAADLANGRTSSRELVERRAKMLDAPPEDTIASLRDRAIL